MSAPRHLPARPRALLVVAVAVASLVALLGPLSAIGAPPAAAQAPADDGTAQGTPGPRLVLVDQSDWVAPDGTFDVALRPEGLTPDTVLTLEVYDKVSDRSSFTELLDPDTLLSLPTLRSGGAPAHRLDELPTAADGAVTLTLPVDDQLPAPTDGVTLFQDGVYPYSVTASDPDGSTLTTFVGHLLRLPTAESRTDEAAMAVGVVVPVHAPVTLGADGAPVLADDDAELLAGQLQALTDDDTVPLTVDATPQTVQALAADDRTADDVDAFAGSLAQRTVLAETYVRVPVGSWVAAGLQPELERQLTVGGTTLTDALDLGPRAPDGTTAVIGPETDPAALAALADLGVEEVVVPSSLLGDAAGDPSALTHLFDVASATGQQLRAVAADELVTAAFSASDDPVLAGHLALAALAELSTEDSYGARGVAVTVPDDVDPVALSTFLGGLTDTARTGGDPAAAPLVAPVPIDALFGITDAATTTEGERSTTLVRPYFPQPPESLGSYPDQLTVTRQQVDGLGSLVPSGGGIVAPVADTVLLSGADDLTVDQANAQLVRARQQVTDTTDEIVVAPEQVVTLTSASGKIPLNLENRLPVEAVVRIVLTSPKLDFPNGQVLDDVTLEAATTTRLDLDVTTRASGAFPLTVEIRSADDSLPVATTKYTVRSTAISGVGLVISIGAGLFLLVWWARHFRSSRRARRLVGSPHPALQTDEPTPPPGGAAG